VSVSVSKLGCTAIHFVEAGVKVNGEYYRNDLLGRKLLPDVRRLSQDEFFVFQQDGAPHIEHATPSLSWSDRCPTSYLRHCGRRIRQTLVRSTTVRVWSVLQEKVYRSNMPAVDELKTRLIDEWVQFD